MKEKSNELVGNLISFCKTCYWFFVWFFLHFFFLQFNKNTPDKMNNILIGILFKKILNFKVEKLQMQIYFYISKTSELLLLKKNMF